MSAVRTLGDVTPDVSVIVPSVSQADHLARCLASLLGDSPRRWSVEVIVVANGATERVRAVARAARVILVESAVNRGFAGGCLLGARHARGRRLLVLNDDVVVRPGWLDPLVETLARPRVGAVGPLVRYPDGRIQEVGSVLWRDGASRPIGHGAPATALEPLVRRRVDYCSASALLIDRAAWDAVGGFDEGYHPAYYEDVDFALRLERAGYEVWADPRSQVTHVESESSTPRFKQFLFARHRARLVAAWPEALAQRLSPPGVSDDPSDVVRASVRRLSTARARVLVVDDRIPRDGLGSGFGRMVDTLLDLRQANLEVTCLPSVQPAEFNPVLAAAGVAIVDQPAPDRLRAYAADADCVIASRPNNAEAVCAAVADLPRRPRVVYDAEALYHRRVERQARLATGREADVLWLEAERWRRLETQLAGEVDTVVCVSEDEAGFFRAHGACDVRVFTPWLRGASPTPASLAGRADIGLVAGWLAGDGSPNADGLRWFAAHVLPLVVSRMPWARLRVTGCPPGTLQDLAGPAIRFEGFVDDLAAFYGTLRVAVVPLRFGSGVKVKTLEALQYGVPVVATRVGAEGLPPGAPLDLHDDPAACAEAVFNLLHDAGAWRQRRRAIDAWLPRAQMGQETWSDVVLPLEEGGTRVSRAL
jgi:O-antigen biosynthesis protein